MKGRMNLRRQTANSRQQSKETSRIHDLSASDTECYTVFCYADCMLLKTQLLSESEIATHRSAALLSTLFYLSSTVKYKTLSASLLTFVFLLSLRKQAQICVQRCRQSRLGRGLTLYRQCTGTALISPTLSDCTETVPKLY